MAWKPARVSRTQKPSKSPKHTETGRVETCSVEVTQAPQTPTQGSSLGKAHGAAREVVAHCASLAEQCRAFTPQDDHSDSRRLLRYAYAEAVLFALDLEVWMTREIRRKSRELYPSGSPPVRIDGREAECSVIEVVERLAATVQTVLHGERQRAFQPGPGQTLESLLARVGLDGREHIIEQVATDWENQSDEEAHKAIHTLRFDGVDFNALSIHLTRECDDVWKREKQDTAADDPALRLRFALEHLAHSTNAARVWEVVADARDAMPNTWDDTRDLLASIDETRAGAAIGPMYANEGKATGKDLEAWLCRWLPRTRARLQEATTLVREAGARLLGSDNAELVGIALREYERAMDELSCALTPGDRDLRSTIKAIRGFAAVFQKGADRVVVRAQSAGADRVRDASPADPSPTGEGRWWFDEQGHLNQSGTVPLSQYLGGLSDQLRLFLARLDSCERNDAGDYLLRDARAGTLGGMRVLWDNVVQLAQASIDKTLPGMTPDQLTVMSRDGVLATATAPLRNAQPLADALRQLLFSIPYNSDRSWVSEIPSATVVKIRTIGAELTQHQAAWEKSEGRFDAGMARERRVNESLGARDDGSNPANNPKPTRRERRVKWLAEAMLTVRDHPEWSDATIAGKVGINKSRLSRSPEYRAAAQMARTPKTPAGSATVVNGDRELEAVDDSFDPNRRASRQWQDEEDTDDRIDREMNETQRKTQRGEAQTPVKRRSGGA